MHYSDNNNSSNEIMIMPPNNFSSSSKNDPDLLLEGVLANAQIPHQPLVIIDDEPTFGGLPLFREIFQRSVSRGERPTLVTALHPANTFFPSDPSSSSSSSSSTSVANVIDLTTSIPGYASDLDIQDFESQITSTYTSGQIFVDALDVLAEDYSPSAVLGLVRRLLETIRTAKAPSRLILLLPPTSSLHPTLTSATFAPTVTHLTCHPPSLVTYLSRQYLSPISTSPTPNLWMILVNASKRALGTDLAWRAEENVEFDPAWQVGKGAVVQVLVRKATGGIKGISRSLEALSSSATDRARVSVVSLDTLVELNPLATATATASNDLSVGRQASSHAELDLPFNLNLTESQRRQRGAVPLPYAHEGEGASGDLIWEDEEETDDEEI